MSPAGQAQARPTQRCWIYDKLYPATQEAYKTNHATIAAQREIQKWAKTAPEAEPSSVRWMRDPNQKKSLVVFGREPHYPGTGYFVASTQYEYVD